MIDQELAGLIAAEDDRQSRCIPLIASENFCSLAVKDALASSFVNKYAEGRPGKRYYAGNEIADQLEILAEKRALKLFVPNDQELWRANVQPLSGTPANLAVLTGLLEVGDRILSMNLDAGGHLSHGHQASLVGRLFEIHDYGVDPKTGLIDYDEVARIAIEIKPKMIIAGTSAYPRHIDFAHFGKIAQECGALLLADISHIAGLVATGLHESPFPHADAVTCTTHKTLRGPRAAVIISRQQHGSAINRALFPGLQGGPHLNQIAATAVALQEAAQPEFNKYAAAVIANAQALAQSLKKSDWKLITDGTDNHLLLIDLTSTGQNGVDAQQKLEEVGIITNANRIPFDQGTVQKPSGLRLGTAAVTTLGANDDWCRRLAAVINDTLRQNSNVDEIKSLVAALRQELLTLVSD